MNRHRFLAPAGLLLAALALPADAADTAHAPAAHAAPSAHAAPAAVASVPAPAPAPAAPSLPPGPKVNAPTRAALETLLNALPPGSGDGLPRERVTARRGETLDALIRRTQGDSPFKEAFLRGAFLEINAAALELGTNRLVPGAQVQVPNTSDLREYLQRVLGPQRAATAAASAPAAAADKRLWVRFP